MIRLYTLVAILLGTSAFAQDMRPQMQQALADHVNDWLQSPLLIAAVNAQNMQTASYDAAKIAELDQLWMAQVGMADVPMVSAVLDNPAAEFLRTRIAAANGTITELFVMDARGLNVAAAAPTSDYWQGDEAKYTETYLKGAGAVHYGDVELDQSTGQVQAQVSVPLVDPATSQVIGALTVGINLNALM